MARTPRLSPRFLAQRRALGIVRHSPASRAVTATIVALCQAETSREPGDARVLLDPDERGVSAMAHVRRVPGLTLWVWYRDLGNVVELAMLTDHPPGA